MGSRVTEVVAQELGLVSFKESPPKLSMLGVTSVEIESEDRFYRLYLVKDSNEEVTSSLDECARLCAYYNSRFVLQYVRTNKIDYPVGSLQINFQIEDGEQTHSVYVLKTPKGEPPKSTLSLEELTIVAENIAKLHGKTADSLGKELYNTITANYENVHLYEKKISTEVINILRQSIKGEHAQYFVRPHDVLETLDCLLSEHGKEFGDVPYKEVICHGNLSAANCIFGGGGKRGLLEITDWECVHFGDPTEDLTNLIFSSADAHIRRNHFMKVFRAYYYALIELRPLRFNLANLKHLFRKNSKKMVIANVELLLNTLSSEASHEEKSAAARRWEAALYDVHQFECGDYISDDEQCYFEK